MCASSEPIRPVVVEVWLDGFPLYEVLVVSEVHAILFLTLQTHSACSVHGSKSCTCLLYGELLNCACYMMLLRWFGSVHGSKSVHKSYWTVPITWGCCDDSRNREVSYRGTNHHTAMLDHWTVHSVYCNKPNSIWVYYFVPPQERLWHQHVPLVRQRIGRCLLSHGRNICVFSHVQNEFLGLTHKRCVLQRISFVALSDVTFVFGMRQSMEYQCYKMGTCEMHV